MSPLVAITGNGAAAEAMRQIDPDVVAAFPITPSTQIVEDFAKFVADGRVGTELVTVESEHSAMSACIGAAVAGGRVMTATSSCGLALMWEMLYVAASMRQPVVMTVVSRALSGPINIHCDHGDIMGCRDAGWVQLFAENNQEAYDNLIMAPRIAEHPDVRLPVMVCMDGFIISHCIETMRLEEDARVRGFVGEFTPVHPLLDTAHPASWGGLDLQDYYMEHKRGQHEAVMNAMSVIRDVSREFAETFGRRYDLFEGYRLDDAERVLVAINSVCGESQGGRRRAPRRRGESGPPEDPRLPPVPLRRDPGGPEEGPDRHRARPGGKLRRLRAALHRDPRGPLRSGAEAAGRREDLWSGRPGPVRRRHQGSLRGKPPMP